MGEPNSTFPPDAPIIQQPVADVRAPRFQTGNQVTYTYPIRQPEEEFSDFQVGVRASVLKRCRTRLESIGMQCFPVHEVLLGVCTLATGGALSALVSGVQMETGRGLVFFVVLPAVAVGCGVAYGMLRHFTLQATHEIVNQILREDLPDPERTIDVRRS